MLFILETIVVFIILLAVLVLAHEFGHFIVAKKSGMQVDEFGFGFPPRIFGVRRGETTYSLNWFRSAASCASRAKMAQRSPTRAAS